MSYLQYGNLSVDLVLAENLLNNKHFIIGTNYLPPFISYNTNVSTDGRLHNLKGYIYEIILYIATYYKFTFHFVNSPDGSYGFIDNGTWKGLTGMLVRKEIDLIGGFIVVNSERGSVVDFGVPVYTDVYSILIPYPTLDATINGIVRPFQYDVWILIAISIASMGIGMWMVTSMEIWAFDKKKSMERPSFYSSFWSLISEFHDTVRGVVENSSRLPVRIVATVWCLSAFILLQAYSCTVTAYLMSPRYHPIISSIEDVATMSRPFLMTTRDTPINISAFNSRALTKIAESWNKYPQLRTQAPRPKVVETVLKNQWAFTSLRTSLLNTMENDFKTFGQCRIYLAKNSWGNARAAFAFKKSSKFPHFFNNQINWLRDVGLLDYWERQNWPKKNKCSEPLSTSKPAENKPLTLDNLSSAFILLGCGFLFSFIVFLMELVRFKIYTSG